MKIFDAFSSIFSNVFGGLLGGFGAPPQPPNLSSQQMQQYSTSVSGPRSEAEKADMRAAMAAQGRRPKEEEIRRQKSEGLRPLQGGSGQSSVWS